MSPSFSPSAQIAIQAAWASWREAVPELDGKVHVGGCRGADVCIREDLGLERMPGGVEEGYDEAGTVTLYTNSVFAYAADARLDADVEMQRIATHELGHALGLGHSAAGNTMSPEIATMALRPTTDDIAAFWK